MSSTIDPVAAAAAAYLVAEVYRQAEMAGRHESDIKTDEFFPIADQVGIDALQLALRVKAQLCFAEADGLEALKRTKRLRLVPKAVDTPT